MAELRAATPQTPQRTHRRFETKAGRPRLYMTEAQKKKAYRERRAARALADLSNGHKTAPPEEVTDMETAPKTPALTS